MNSRVETSVMEDYLSECKMEKNWYCKEKMENKKIKKYQENKVQL